MGLRREESQMSAIPVVDQALKGLSLVSGPMQRLLDRSGLELTVGTLILMCVSAGAAGYIAVVFISHFRIAAAVVGVLFFYMPIWFVNFMAKRRLYKFEEQFPEAIDLLSRALRAGHAFTTGLSMVAEEFVGLIQHQRSFSANPKTITTADEMLQELINIKR